MYRWQSLAFSTLYTKCSWSCGLVDACTLHKHQPAHLSELGCIIGLPGRSFGRAKPVFRPNQRALQLHMELAFHWEAVDTT